MRALIPRKTAPPTNIQDDLGSGRDACSFWGVAPLRFFFFLFPADLLVIVASLILFFNHSPQAAERQDPGPDAGDTLYREVKPGISRLS
jgi:hypothetical protein